MSESELGVYSYDLFHNYRDALKGGPVSLSNSQAGQGTNFSQPRAHLLVNPCIGRTGKGFVALAVSNLSLLYDPFR